MQGYYEHDRDEVEHAIAWYRDNDSFAPHFHNSLELVYVLEGELLATLDGAEHALGPGMMAISSSYTVHSYDTPERSLSVVATIPLTEVPSIRQLIATKDFASRVCRDDEGGTLLSLLRMMAASVGNAIVMKGLCYTVLGILIERVGLEKVRRSRRTMFIRDVLEFLQQHHTEPLSVERLAAHFGYSRSRFSHIFNAHLGYSVMEYVNSLRCRHAVQLLKETEMAVSEVAMAVGFESLRTFYRAFKKQYDMTPNQHARGYEARNNSAK